MVETVPSKSVRFELPHQQTVPGGSILAYKCIVDPG